MNKCLWVLILINTTILANDSTGYLSTGGVQYLKNKDIQMYSEDLFISKKQIKIENYFESDFADTEKLLKSFKVQVSGKSIQPKMHVRTFIQIDDQSKPIDLTTEFQHCGFTEKEMLNPWNREDDQYDIFEEKLKKCPRPALQKVLARYQDEPIRWWSQVIYIAKFLIIYHNRSYGILNRF